MSWFVYNDQQRRRYRKGIWLRIRSLPSELLAKIQKHMQRNETLAWVVVQELKPNNQVLLEIWCNQTKFPWTQKTPERYTVFHLLVDENPDWVCEGDLGRGLVQ
jgi:hypothetical protein